MSHTPSPSSSDDDAHTSPTPAQYLTTSGLPPGAAPPSRHVSVSGAPDPQHGGVVYPPNSPTSAHTDMPLLPQPASPTFSPGSGAGAGGSATMNGGGGAPVPRGPARSSSSGAGLGFASSPLHPSPLNPRPSQTHTASNQSYPSTSTSPSPSPSPFTQNPFAGGSRSRPASRASLHPSLGPGMGMPRIASEESQALSSLYAANGTPTPRGSMLLYRLASDDDGDALVPPSSAFASNAAAGQRNSVVSQSGDSLFSLSSDSKYPIAAGGAGMGYGSGRGRKGGYVAYLYDPALDTDGGDEDEDDLLHAPLTGASGRNHARGGSASSGEKSANGKNPSGGWSGLDGRGALNVLALTVLIGAIIALFVFYPVFTYYKGLALNEAIEGNFRVNSTGQVPNLPHMPSLVDKETPNSALTRTGFDGEDYELVFSDEFETDGRTFWPGDDPFWEAVDLWYWATNDLEWYTPDQIYTANGSLNIVMEALETNGLPFRSGMLQSWNKFCFTGGYVEVSLTLPGPNSDTQGYWPGAWTMGNLGRPGYGATTDGMWPYTYDSCDVGTFPNQTYANGTGPAAALNVSASSAKYDFQLSVLSGQRLSACTCPGSDHPGPTVADGRGAPEIDMLEAQRNKVGAGGRVSQSAQFAPFTHEFLYTNTTTSDWQIYNTSLSVPNPYLGSPVQQAVSVLSTLPEDMFEGSGGVFTTVGFEYWADPGSRDSNFITWSMGGEETWRMSATSVGPDPLANGGSGVAQRLIPEEPLSLVLNLGMSTNWQHLNFQSMTFPATMKVDYVRVYQRKGHTNINCSPPDYPTAQYIQDHNEAYTNANFTEWRANAQGSGAGYDWPVNSLYNGGC